MKTRILILAAFAALTLHATAQSLLVEQPETVPERTAREITEGIQGSKRALLGEFRHNVSTLWDAPDPQAVLDELGPKAAELFWLSQQFATFLGTIMTAANDAEGLAELSAILAKVKPSTINPDGTVTINPEPSPTPEP